MDPNNPNPNNQQPLPGPIPPAPPQRPSEDWQRQAVAGAQASVQSPQPQQPSMSTALPPQPTVSAPMSDMSGQPQMGIEPPQPKNNKRLIILISAIVAAIVLAVAAYFLFFHKSTSVSEASKKSQESASASAIDISSLASATLNAPSDLSGLHKSDLTSTATYSTYLNEAETCEVDFGTLSATVLPGTTAEDMVNKQLTTLRDVGATVNGPEAGDALVLTSATDPSVTYKLPTLVFTFSKDQTNVRSHYSVAILGNGTRAVVTRVCINTGGQPVSDDALTTYDAKAGEVTVTPGQ